MRRNAARRTAQRAFPSRCGMLAGALLALTGAVPTEAQDPDPIADSLLTLWTDSVGGMKTYHRFRSASFTVTTVWYDTVSGRITRTRPRYAWIRKGPHGEEARVERWESGGLIQQGFNGRDPAWAAEDGRLLPDSARDAREALYVARDVFYWFGLPFKLRDRGVYLSYLGKRERPGEDLVSAREGPGAPPAGAYHAIGVSFGEGVGEHSDVFTYYFADGRGFPTEVTYVEEGRTNLNRLLWGETHGAGEIGYPYVVRRDMITQSGKRIRSLVLSEVEINPEIPQERFERP